MRRFRFLGSWKFWAITAILLAGCFIDLDRTKAYGWFSLKLCLILGILALVGYFLTDKEKYQRTVTYDRRSGRRISESDWKFKGYSSPADRDRSNSMAGCFFAFPIFALLIGLLVASLANTGSALMGWPKRYTKPGSPVPTTKSPDEIYRVTHPDGFSMVFPAKWKVSVQPEGLRAWDSASNYFNSFFAGKFSTSDTNLLVDKFQERPARKFWYTGNKVIRSLMQDIYFKHEGQWYALRYSALNYKRKRGPLKKKPLPIVDEYFQTFRFTQ